MCTSCIGTADAKPYKFEDGDVSECKMEDDEEMKNQCFGGEYMGEVFGHVVKRSYRRRKRWWNAYILFYTKEDIDVSNRMSDLTINEPVLSPSPISLFGYRAKRPQAKHKVPAHVQPVFGGILPIHEETDWLSTFLLTRKYLWTRVSRCCRASILLTLKSWLFCPPKLASVSFSPSVFTSRRR